MFTKIESDFKTTEKYISFTKWHICTEIKPNNNSNLYRVICELDTVFNCAGSQRK
jgi:hypothetical protein